MEEIISLNNVVKTFYSQKVSLFSLRKTRIEVFKRLNFSLKKAQTVAVLGPNGCGKTTLFKMLSTLILPNGGKIRVDGFDPASDPIPVRERVSFVTSEERSFYFRLTGRQNLRFFATLCNIRKKEALKRIEAIASLLRLEDHMDIKYQEFSTGLKQKLNLARGLIRDFSILILDEPIKSVDCETSAAIMKHIRETLVKNEGKTVIMATHNLSEAQNYADRFILINDTALAGDIRKTELGSRSLEDFYRGCIKEKA